MNADDTRLSQLDLLRDLRSVRSFTPEPVPDQALQDIFEIVRLSGSAKNEQPWDLVVIETRKTLDQLAAMPGYVGHLASAPLAIALVMAGDNVEYATFDEGKIAERIMLAAAAFGLGSCIGWFDETARDEARTQLGAPASSIVRTIISIGYPTPEQVTRNRMAKVDRKSIEQFVHREHFGA